MPFIKTVRCGFFCGYERRHDGFKAGSTVPCPTNGCDEELVVRIESHPYGTMFRRGDPVRVFAPQTLGFRHDNEYPLRRLHEESTKYKRTFMVLEEGPDVQGTVLIQLPFFYKPAGLDSRGETNIMPVLASLLKPA